MKTYHKIQTLFFRDPDDNYKTVMKGVFSKPEFEYLYYNDWLVDEKIDGTNIRILWDGVNMEIRGKTDAANLHPELIANIQKLVTPEKLADVFGTVDPLRLTTPLAVCLYGEGFGPGIQKGGGNYRSDKSFIMFDVNIDDKWLKRKNVKDIAAKLGVETVPEIGIMTLSDAVKLVESGLQSTFGEFEAEGIIARPVNAMQNEFGERVITKLKCKDFKK